MAEPYFKPAADYLRERGVVHRVTAMDAWYEPWGVNRFGLGAAGRCDGWFVHQLEVDPLIAAQARMERTRNNEQAVNGILHLASQVWML